MPSDIGSFIRDLRNNARISLRELAERAGVSNPYLSQIERGLRRPSAEVLSQIAGALRVSTAVMYLRAGLLPDKDGHSVLGAIAADPDLTAAQKQSLIQIYETFRRENARAGLATDAPVATEGSGATANGAASADGAGAHEDAGFHESADSRAGANDAGTDHAGAVADGGAASAPSETVRANRSRRPARG
jgi:transcriptional regulator with XRE-family HTH domain